ncbi:MAG: biotin--[acetyl-CoA-carboxylase] ligase [Polyangiales bacterium]
MSASADLDLARLEPLLRTARYGRSLRLLPLTDSTNDDARRDAEAGAPDGHVVVADGQRSGRGSHGRVWSSPPGTDLYLSIVARPRVPLADLPPLTLAVGLGTAEAVEHSLGPGPERVEVKWPNDVWISGKKCAGILVEATSSASVLGPLVIGIGLNVNRTQWPVELAADATSLRAARGAVAALDRAVVLATLLGCIEGWVDRFVAQGSEVVTAALQSRLALRGQAVRCDGIEGQLRGVAPNGALLIANETGVHELLAGRLERS